MARQWWEYLLPLFGVGGGGLDAGYNFAKNIFGGSSSNGDTSSSTNQQTQETTTPARGYQSPYLGLADLYTLQTMMSMLNRYSGAGWPGGSSGGWGNPFTQEILGLLSGNMGDLLNNYRQPTIPDPGQGSTQNALNRLGQRARKPGSPPLLYDKERSGTRRPGAQR